MLAKTAKEYHAEKKGNCAESVAYAYLVSKNTSLNEMELALAEMKLCGGGRAPNGLCGALYAALRFAKSENKQAIQEYFEKNAGGICCKDIRPAKITPCNRCVEIAAEAIEKLDT